MLRKVFISVVAALLMLYVAFAVIFLTGNREEDICRGVYIDISGDCYGVLTADNITDIIKAERIEPTGKPMGKIDCSILEHVIGGYSLVQDCQCYKTQDGIVSIRVKSRKPIMQVFDKYGGEFYIDAYGGIIEGVRNAIYLPVASGNIDRSMAADELLNIALFLQENRFWREQTEQIFFDACRNAVIVPKVGEHIIEIGRVENLEKKLSKLEKFYKEALNEIGWNKYSKLNIEFDNKVIGTKR